MRPVVFVMLLVACGGNAQVGVTPHVTPAAVAEVRAFLAQPDTVAIAGGGSDGDMPAPGPHMRVHLIDVGQGAATLIEFSCAAMLVDTGGETNGQYDSTNKLMTYLEAFFQTRPDLHDTLALLVITHPHIDHDRGAPAVWNRFKVANVVTDGMTNSSGGSQQAALLKVARRDGVGLDTVEAARVPAGGLTDAVIDPIKCDDGDPDIRVLWGHVSPPDVSWSHEALVNANNHSVVTRVALGKTSILITGDLEKDGIKDLLAHQGGALASSVYEVGHHGSYNATTKELLAAISPQMALIAMGPSSRHETYSAWAFGHPREVTVELLEHAVTGKPRPTVTEPIADGAKRFSDRAVTAPIYATGWDGDVRVTMYAEGDRGFRTRKSEDRRP